MARFYITLVAEGECSFTVDLPTDDPSAVTEEFMQTVFSHALDESVLWGGEAKRIRCLVEDWCDLTAVLADDHGVLVTKDGEEIVGLDERSVHWEIHAVALIPNDVSALTDQ